MFVFLLPVKMRTPKMFYACMMLCLWFYAYGVKSNIGVGNMNCYLTFLHVLLKVTTYLSDFRVTLTI